MEDNVHSYLEQSTSIRHFTDVDALFSILQEGFRFSVPNDKWDDQNDAFTLSEYGRIKSKDVYILCFCEGIGNMYHWVYFGRKKKFIIPRCCGSLKCNIKLNKAKFEKFLLKRGMKLQPVIYASKKEINETLTDLSKLPLLKRSEYSVEKELRIIVELEQGSHVPENLKIPDGCIEGINILMDKNARSKYSKIKEKLLKTFPYLEDDMIDYNGSMESVEWQECVRDKLETIM